MYEITDDKLIKFDLAFYYCLRGPVPKKRPMISSSKIESADFYFPSRGYRILFKNEFLLFQFALNQKYRAANFSRPIAAKSGRK